MNIYVNFKPQSIKELLTKLLLPVEANMQTSSKLITYANEECTIVQCYAGKIRSFDDIYDLCKTYFPEITEADVIHNLILLTPFNAYVYPTICSTINKPVFNWYSSKLINQSYLSHVDRKPTQSNYSWKQVFEFLFDVDSFHDCNSLFLLINEYYIKHTKKIEEQILT